MKIGFEAKRLFANFTGLGNYSRFIVNALSALYPKHNYFLYTPRASEHSEVETITSRPNVTVVTPGMFYTGKVLSSLWRTWAVHSEPTVQTLDIFHGLSQELPLQLSSKIRKVVTIHDLIFLRYPQFYRAVDVNVYKLKAAYACKTADKIIAVSQQTAADIQHFFGDHLAPKITVVYQGVHPNFNRVVTADEIESVRRKYSLPANYILNIGTIEERKNLLVLVKALAMVPPDFRIPLVVIGRKTPYCATVQKEIARLQLTDYVLFVHNAAFEDFAAIYKGARVFLYPSLFEGFGIPLVEAIKSGVPVITSTGSCFSEAAGPHSIYVHPQNADEIAAQIVTLISDEDKRAAIVKNSQKYIERFSPDVVANDLMKVYLGLL